MAIFNKTFNHLTAKLALVPIRIYFNRWQEIVLRFAWVFLWFFTIGFCVISGVQYSFSEHLSQYRTNFITYQTLIVLVRNSALLIMIIPLIWGLLAMFAILSLKSHKAIHRYIIFNYFYFTLLIVVFIAFNIYILITMHSTYLNYIIIAFGVFCVAVNLILSLLFTREMQTQYQIKSYIEYSLSLKRFAISERMQYEAKQKLASEEVQDVLTTH